MTDEHYQIVDVSESTTEQKKQKSNLKKAIGAFLLASIIAMVNPSMTSDSNLKKDENNFSMSMIVDEKVPHKKVWQKEVRFLNQETGEYSTWMKIPEFTITHDVLVDSATERYIYMGLASEVAIDLGKLPLCWKETRQKNSETGEYSEFRPSSGLIVADESCANSELERYMFAGCLNLEGDNLIIQKQTREPIQDNNQYTEWHDGGYIINPENIPENNDIEKWKIYSNTEVIYQTENTLERRK